MEDNKNIATRHFMMAENFLQLVENVICEAVKSGNGDIYIGPPRNDIGDHYKSMTKWSDFRILVPVLFNFFHAIELLLKAANYKIGDPLPKPNHKLSELYLAFQKNYPNSIELMNIFEKYIYPGKTNNSVLAAFYNSNNITNSDKFYEIFRYPFKKNFKEDFNYKSLGHLNSEGLNLFRQIIIDIETLKYEINQL
jgi:hypothetical protein